MSTDLQAMPLARSKATRREPLPFLRSKPLLRHRHALRTLFRILGYRLRNPLRKRRLARI